MDKTLIEIVMPENKRMKELLGELWAGKLSMVDFDKECAYWFISCDDLAPKLLPTRPKELLEYDSWTLTEKKNASDKFWRQESVYNYLEQKQGVIERNRGMRDKLIEFKAYIPKGDTPTLRKFDSYIYQYNHFFNNLSEVDRNKIHWEFKPEYQEVPENWQDR